MISKLTMKRFLALSAASIVCVAMARPAAQAQESAQQQIATEEQTATGQEPLLERQTAAETLVRALSLEFQHQQVGTHSLGVTVVPVDATLRAQLALSPDQGLVVLNVDADSPAS